MRLISGYTKNRNMKAACMHSIVTDQCFLAKKKFFPYECNLLYFVSILESLILLIRKNHSEWCIYSIKFTVYELCMSVVTAKILERNIQSKDQRQFFYVFMDCFNSSWLHVHWSSNVWNYFAAWAASFSEVIDEDMDASGEIKTMVRCQ